MGLLDLKIQLHNKIEGLRGKKILDTFSGKLKGDDYIILLTEEKELIMVCSDFDSDYERCELLMANHRTLFDHIVENKNLQSFLRDYEAIDYKAFRNMVRELKEEMKKDYLIEEERKERELYEELKKKYEKGE